MQVQQKENMTNKNYVITKEQEQKIRDISAIVIGLLDAIKEFEKFLSKENENDHREQIYGEQQVLIPQLHWYQAQLKSAQFAVNFS